jgi:hypothetical protein
MAIEHIPVERVGESDLFRLIENAVPESMRLDYKRALSIVNDGEKTEFLKDVSAFANAEGGDLIYGVDETDGAASALGALEGVNPDDLPARLMQIVYDGLEPNVAGVEARAIPLANQKHVVIVRIPKSWSAPHMVTRAGHRRFYQRKGTLNLPMDIEDLRRAFLRAESVADRLRSYRRDRIAEISDVAAVTRMAFPSVAVIHIIPFAAFEPGATADLTLPARQPHRIEEFAPRCYEHRWNADGFLAYNETSTPKRKLRLYTQLHRTGVIEIVVSLDTSSNNQSIREIRGVAFGDDVLKRVEQGLKLLTEFMRVPLPHAVMVSLLHCKDVWLRMETGYWSEDHGPIDRDSVLVPEAIFMSFDVPVSRMMKPVMDALWNAGGWPMCPLYDEAGNFK